MDKIQQYQQQPLVIATQHHKEQVIAPIFEQALGVACFLPTGFDTDKLGTFSGEIERVDDPLTTLRRKCQMAMEATGARLGVASEGSFGPHPSYYFITAGEEWMIFIDQMHGIEILAKEINAQTNFGGTTVETWEQLQDFAQRAGFPSHGLIIKAAKQDVRYLKKGIQQADLLQQYFNESIQQFGTCYVETDMRALYNPTRMQQIEKLTQQLVEKILSVCPTCKTPGFSITTVKQGLPCSWCGRPTRLPKYFWSHCQHCGLAQQTASSEVSADPGVCDFCNP